MRRAPPWKARPRSTGPESLLGAIAVMSHHRWSVSLSAALLFALPGDAMAQTMGRLDFTRLIAHWAEYSDPGYLSFIEDTKPEIAQVGFYGAHFWSLAHTAFGNGYP